jgi:putative flippase GtrA
VDKTSRAPRPRGIIGRLERLAEADMPRPWSGRECDPPLRGRARLGIRTEAALAAKHAAASVVGFAVDFVVLHLVMGAGLEPAWARVVSLACAVNATFVLNGALVFRCLGWGRRLWRQWLAYIATNAFGNLCNYWIFVTLVSLHHPLVSRPTVALFLACLSAWGINYSAARLVVFGRGLRRRRRI